VSQNKHSQSFERILALFTTEYHIVIIDDNHETVKFGGSSSFRVTFLYNVLQGYGWDNTSISNIPSVDWWNNFVE